MISHRIDHARRVLIVTCQGNLTTNEISRFQAEVRGDPDFDPSLALLVDLREASLSLIEAADVRRHAEEDPIGPKSPRAMLVCDDLNYGIVRMFEAYSDLSRRAGPVQVFDNPEDAYAWIEQIRAVPS